MKFAYGGTGKSADSNAESYIHGSGMPQSSTHESRFENKKNRTQRTKPNENKQKMKKNLGNVR